MTPQPEHPLGADRARASFAAELTSVPAARHYTTEQLSKWGMTEHADTAGLIVSELASNVVRHAHSGFDLELSHTDEAVQIVVSDASNDVPVLRDHRPGGDGGNGLRIISTLATDWGFELRDAGKQVWARLASAPLGLSSPRPEEPVPGVETPGPARGGG